ncbi:VanW family protein [Patescibacteria group bacterium]|nr:VanW family protein [Patescibacteria group bacterium]
MSKESKEKKSESKVMLKPALIWAGITIGVIALFVAMLGGGVYAYTRMYENKIYPGVKVLNIRLDGLTKDEARQKIQQATDNALEKGLFFNLDGKEVALQASSNNDLPDLVLYDIDSAINDAYNTGRSSGVNKVVYEILRARIRPINVNVKIQIDEVRILSSLEAQYHDELPDPIDATFKININEQGTPEVWVIPDEDGSKLNMEGVYNKLRQQAEIVTFQPITLHVEKVFANRRANQLQPLIDKVQEVLKRPQIVFTYDDKEYPIKPADLAGWLVASNEDDTVTIDHDLFASSIHMLAKDIEVESKSGSMEVKDGEIVSFTAGTMGKSINTEKTLEAVLNSWPPSSTFPLVVEEEHGQITGDALEEFGIKELLGVGRSNFRGSPYNRTQNIKKAVNDHVNGTLLAPGETFSMLQSLGEIDGAHGWLPELVIKGNKTLPEYGGGLCQIGTTMFRGAVDTGLPVTERRNHSYRVSYYEPAGTDATIYDPAPDFKFVNDTEKYIYINAYIVGTEITFEFWGTDDGRQVEYTSPVIYNITAPPPTKLVETTDLAPGKKKCTESAHSGADAYFESSVIYADGRTREETFHSHYRPWQAVCLIGVESLSDESAKAAE